jgi:hypothetical protein
MGCCQKFWKCFCTRSFIEYPIELRNAEGEAVLTQRREHLGCCSQCRHCIIGLSGLCIPCKVCCSAEYCEAAFARCLSRCTLRGCKCGGKLGESPTKPGCSSCRPQCLGGTCFMGPNLGCSESTWMEPFVVSSEAWLGPKADKSNQIVATIDHAMNIQYTQCCVCCRSSKLSDVYHTQVNMPADYGDAEWQTLVGWVGRISHLMMTTSAFESPGFYRGCC